MVKRNNELFSLYKADRQERIDQPNANTPEYKAMRVRDLERRERGLEARYAQKIIGNTRPVSN